MDPLYVDVIVRRWQALTGLSAQHAKSGDTFEAITAKRQTKAAEAVCHG